MISFKRTYSIVERSSEDSTSNEKISSVKGCEEKALSNKIFEKRENIASINQEESTSGKNIKESSFKKDVVCLKLSHEEEGYEVTKTSYK